jgi:cysteine desulfurase
MESASLNKTTTKSLDSEKVSSSQQLLKPIYLDNHSTTHLDPIVFEAMLPYLKDNFGNPSSTHIYGIKAQHAVSIAREQVARAINAETSEVIFTSGATESNNFVVKGVYEHFKDIKPHFIISNIEHKCILEAAEHVSRLGAELTVLEASSEGKIEPEDLEKAIQPNTVLVSLMFANNEIGTINPLKELIEVAHEKNILFHTDAAQAVGKLPIDVKDLDIDFLSASGHKFYGPKGIGFIYVKQSSQKFLTPLLDGGGQEAKLRSGTLNVPGIVGIGKAIELSTTDMPLQTRHYRTLRDQLYKRLNEAFPDLILNGPAIEQASDTSDLKRLPHNLNITLPSIAPDDLDKVYNVAFSSTSACSSGDPEPSYVLMAIGRSLEEARVSIRFGIGRFNSETEIELAADDLIATLGV